VLGLSGVFTGFMLKRAGIAARCWHIAAALAGDGPLGEEGKDARYQERHAINTRIDSADLDTRVPLRSPQVVAPPTARGEPARARKSVAWKR